MSVEPAKLTWSLRSVLAATCLVVGLAFALPSAAPALPEEQTRHVSVGGSDVANNCLNPEAPCGTVQHAVEQADDYDVVAVGPGTYLENVVVAKSLTLRGVEPAEADAEGLLDPGALTTQLEGSGGAPALTLRSPADDQPMPEIAIENLRVDGRGNFDAVRVESVGAAEDRSQIRSLAFEGVALVGSPSAINTTGPKPVHGFELTGSAIRCTGEVTPTGGVLLGMADGGEGLPVVVSDNYMTECGAAINAGDHTGFAGTTGAVAGEAVIARNTIEDDRWGCILIALAYEDLTIADNRLSDCDLEPNAWDSAINLQSTPGPTWVMVRGNEISGEEANVGVIVQNVTAHPDAPDALASFAVEQNTIEGLTVSASSTAIRLGPTQIQRTAENIEVSVVGNTLVGNSRGFDWQTGAGDTVGENLVLRGNRFHNVERGVSLFGAGRSIDAEDNWWGCNEGAQVQAAGKTPDGCDSIGIADPDSSSVDADPRLVLSAEADPGAVQVGGQTSAIVAAIESNSEGTAGLPAPNGTPVAFATDLGELTPTSAPLSAGVAGTTLSSGEAAGQATVTATVDGETATAPLWISARPVPDEILPPPPVAAPRGELLRTRHRQPQVGTLRCESACQVVSHAGVVMAGGRAIHVRVRVRTPIEAGGKARVRVYLNRAARATLARAGVGTILVRLTVLVGDQPVEQVLRARVRPPRPR